MVRISLCFLLLATLIGCGGGRDLPDLGSVTGTVTLDGQELPKAVVQFTPVEGGRPASAVTDSSGRYELEYSAGNPGAKPGSYRVSITTASTETNEQGEDVQIPEKLPAKYNANTELTAEVNKGDNKIDFPLDSQGEIAKPEDDGCN